MQAQTEGLDSASRAGLENGGERRLLLYEQSRVRLIVAGAYSECLHGLTGLWLPIFWSVNTSETQEGNSSTKASRDYSCSVAQEDSMKLSGLPMRQLLGFQFPS